mgnify:CR=1 FL=1
MTGTESTRAIVRIEAGISALNEKLDKVPDWTDIDRQEARRDAEQKKQDEAIKTVEGKVNTLMMAVIVASLGSAGSLVTAIATAGI